MERSRVLTTLDNGRMVTVNEQGTTKSSWSVQFQEHLPHLPSINHTNIFIETIELNQCIII